MREDERTIKSCAMSNDRQYNEIDEVSAKIELHGIIRHLSRQMTLNTCEMQSESEMTNEIDIAPSNEEETSHNKLPTEQKML